jgi:uncharacterized protein (DUF2235 family)
MLGLASGYGLRTNLAEAYTYLMQTYRPDDRVFLFGFSRGAYTARALCGMTHRAGLLRPGAENLVPYAVNVYARSKREWDEGDWVQIDKFASVFSVEAGRGRSLPVHFVGIWDSVKAAGILRWNLKWPYTRQLSNAATVRHAVSIDERRRPYREYLVQAREEGPNMREVWFAGTHSDVGGSFEDDRRLGDITLQWMAEHAVACGLIVDRTALAEARAVSIDHALGKQAGWIWALLTYRRRAIRRRPHPSERQGEDAADAGIQPEVAGRAAVGRISVARQQGRGLSPPASGAGWSSWMTAPTPGWSD